MSLESTSFIFSSTSFWYQFLYFRLTYSVTYHFFLFWFTTLFVHNSLSFSLPAWKLPVSQILLPVVSLLPSGLPSRDYRKNVHGKNVHCKNGPLRKNGHGKKVHPKMKKEEKTSTVSRKMPWSFLLATRFCYSFFLFLRFCAVR